MLRSAVLSAWLLALVPPAVDPQIAVSVGAGAQSCGQWLEARRAKSGANMIRENMILSWVQGFVFGYARVSTSDRMIEDLAGRLARGELPPNILDSDPEGKVLKIQQQKFGTKSGLIFDPPDGDAIKAWIDKYCRERPLETVSQAAAVLMDDLDPAARPTPHPSGKR